MEFEIKPLNNHGKIMEFCEITVARKLAVRHTKHVCLTASFLASFQVLIISKCMHGLQACLVKYITVAAFCIYLRVVKMGLKGEVGGDALKSHGNYIVDHG